MKLIYGVLIWVFAAGAAQAQPKTTTGAWFGPWSPPDANDRQVDLNTAIAIKQDAVGTLALHGMNVTINNSITNIGSLSNIAIDNGDGTVTVKVDQDTKIGSQDGAGTGTINTDGDFDINNIINQ